MKSTRTFAALALLVFLGVAACNDEAGQDAPPPGAGDEPGAMAPQQEMDPEMMALMMEAQEIQQKLAPIQQEAMQDEVLSAQLQQLQEQVETAMREESPDLFERMDNLEAEYMAAQEAEDEERMQELGGEAQAVQMELQALQGDVLDRPEIREPIDAFEEAQRQRMLEIDPEAGELLDRMEEIMAQLDTPR